MEIYPFAWLDEVIEVAMNPKVSDITTLKPADLRQIIEKFPAETRQVFSSLKYRTICLLAIEKTRVAVEEYETAVLDLAIQAKYNMEANIENDLWVETGRVILAELEGLSANIHQRYRRYLPKHNLKPGADVNLQGMSAFKRLLFKVLTTLTVDQIGIIFFSAQRVKVVQGDSFRNVCQAVAPYVSTERYEHVSPGGIRTAAGKPEDRDKKIAVEALKKIIDDIEGH